MYGRRKKKFPPYPLFFLHLIPFLEEIRKTFRRISGRNVEDFGGKFEGNLEEKRRKFEGEYPPLNSIYFLYFPSSVLFENRLFNE